MQNAFKEISPEEIPGNPFKLIDKEWMLITAGSLEAYNTMTASWGALGELWNKNVAICFVRPSRYTYQFMEEAEAYTLSFYPEQYRDALDFCGSNSGRDVNKAAETRLVPVQGPFGTVYFEQARLVLVCKKLYYQDIDPKHFVTAEIEKNYPSGNYHRVYIGEIVQCLAKP